MDFPAWGLHVSEWAAAGMKEAHIHERRAEWLTLRGLIWLPLALAPPLSLLPCTDMFLLWSRAQRPQVTWMDTASAASSSFRNPDQEKEMRGERLSPSVSLSIRAT